MTTDEHNARPSPPPPVRADGVSAVGAGFEPLGDFPAATPAGTRALGRSVSGSLTWVMGATLVNKSAAFVTQAVLGWLLTKGDFGLFFTAVAVAGLITVCRDMGIREVLIERGKDAYATYSGPGFWMALSYNLMMAAVMASLAWPLSVYVFDDHRLAEMLWIMAAGLPLGTLSAVMQPRLRMELRFKEFSRQAAASSLLRQGTTIALALSGFEHLSLAIPVVVVAVFDSATTWWIVRGRPWRSPPQTALWGGMFRDSKWLMLCSFAIVALDFGPALAIGAVLGASSEINGVYSFAYAITAQVGSLLAFNFQLVIFPALALLKREPERQCQAALRALRALMLLGAVSSLGLAAIIAPLQHLVWRGHWAVAVPAAMVFGLFFPWRISFGLTAAFQLARGRFRQHAVATAIEGLGMIGAATVGATLLPGVPTPVGIALCTGLWLFISRLGMTIWVFGTAGTPAREVLAATVPAWLIAIAGAGVAIALDRTIAPHVETLAARLADLGPSPGVARSIVDLCRIALAGTICLTIFVALTRTLLAAQLSDALRALPARLRRPLERFLLLRGDNA